MRTFRLAAILAVTHHLPIKAGPYREIMEYLTGIELSGPMHAEQYRNVCTEWITKQHPHLLAITTPTFPEDDYAAQDQWVEDVAAKLGATQLNVDPLPPGRQGETELDLLQRWGVLSKTWVLPAPPPAP